MIKKIAGHRLQFDWGTMEMIAKLTGQDAVSPLAGIPTGDQFKYIFAGASMRVMEAEKETINSNPAVHVEVAQTILKDFSLSEIKSLLVAFNEFWNLDVEVPEPEKKTENSQKDQ
jgi:hypothetical protein